MPSWGQITLIEISDSKVVKLEMQDTFLVSFFIMEDNWAHLKNVEVLRKCYHTAIRNYF